MNHTKRALLTSVSITRTNSDQFLRVGFWEFGWIYMWCFFGKASLLAGVLLVAHNNQLKHIEQLEQLQIGSSVCFHALWEPGLCKSTSTRSCAEIEEMFSDCVRADWQIKTDGRRAGRLLHILSSVFWHWNRLFFAVMLRSVLCKRRSQKPSLSGDSKRREFYSKSFQFERCPVDLRKSDG